MKALITVKIDNGNDKECKQDTAIIYQAIANSFHKTNGSIAQVHIEDGDDLRALRIHLNKLAEWIGAKSLHRTITYKKPKHGWLKNTVSGLKDDIVSGLTT